MEASGIVTGVDSIVIVMPYSVRRGCGRGDLTPVLSWCTVALRQMTSQVASSAPMGKGAQALGLGEVEIADPRSRPRPWGWLSGEAEKRDQSRLRPRLCH